MSSEGQYEWERTGFSPVSPNNPATPVGMVRQRSTGVPLSVVVFLLMAQLFVVAGGLLAYRWWNNNYPSYHAARGRCPRPPGGR